MSNSPLPESLMRAVPPVESTLNRTEAATPPGPWLHVSVAPAAVAESKNNVTPPPAPLTMAPLFVIALLPALVVSQNTVVPPADRLSELPLLIKVAWSAVALLWKFTVPDGGPFRPPHDAHTGGKVTKVAVPAVALFENVSVPAPPSESTP